MEMIEGQYSKDPTLGYRRMTAVLRKKTGKPINKKRARRLIRLLRIKGGFSGGILLV
ncbi:MAG: transposase [Thermotogaceae bacterium]|nr:transposase [Thermotogaceae bacterium]